MDRFKCERLDYITTSYKKVAGVYAMPPKEFILSMHIWLRLSLFPDSLSNVIFHALQVDSAG